ncbi:hypothetical protein QE152_g14024 [Popillia japonica]|uniref:Peptidase A2 domain-containing protein n=1 Tax=Popillia japonica TaxID=7064 RepID=A0AAW1LAK1_POPJA
MQTERTFEQGVHEIQRYRPNRPGRRGFVYTVNQLKIVFELDSGAAITLMNLKDFKKYFSNLQLQKTHINLGTYSKQALHVAGFAQVQVTYGDITKKLNLYVVNTEKQPLLGREWIHQLHINFSTSDIAHISTNTQLESILQKYSAVFEKDMARKVENELDHLEKEGVLEKVNSSEYATPIVPIVKANGNIRICGDFKCTLNPNLIVDEYPYN